MNLDRPQYVSAEGGLALKTWIEGHVPDTTPLHITGHSLGSALAQYLAYDLAGDAARQMDLTTFERD